MRDIPQIDTTSTADISFILLIFFLLITSLKTYDGLEKQMPQADDRQIDKTKVKRRNALQAEISATGAITFNDKLTDSGQLIRELETFIENPRDIATLPEHFSVHSGDIGTQTGTPQHTIIVNVHPEAEYNDYFRLQDAINQAYQNVRNRAAKRILNKPYKQLTEQQQYAIRQLYPHNVMELTAQNNAH